MNPASYGIAFDAPRFLLLPLLLVPFILFDLVRLSGLRRALAHFARGGAARAIVFRAFLSRIFFALFLASLAFALAGPRWGSRMVSVPRRGLDIVFAIDLSRSMGVRDLPASIDDIDTAGTAFGTASRLEAAIALAHGLRLRASGIRMGAAIGRGKAILAVPLTYDEEAVSLLLDSLSSDSITGGGTNLESLLDAASTAFTQAFPSRRLIILLSDGEELSGRAKAALPRLQDAEIALCVLGIGSDAGGPIPRADLPGSAMLDDNGNAIVSRRQSALLRSLADRAGGVYFDASSPSAIDSAAAYIDELAGSRGIAAARREVGRHWGAFAFAAFVFWSISRMAAIRAARTTRPQRMAQPTTMRGDTRGI